MAKKHFKRETIQYLNLNLSYLNLSLQHTL